MAGEFFRRGTSKVLWFASAPASPPTAANITAAIDLSPQLAAIDGFNFSTDFIDVENLASRSTPQIAGASSIEGGTLTFNEKKAATVTPSTHDPIMVALAKDATGTLGIAPYGTATGNDIETWPVTVGSFSRSFDMGNTVARWMVELAATEEPVQHQTIAA